MKFYLCQTEEGPQYVHLQADAKKLDPNFETVEIDLAKQAIMERLNDLMRQASNQPVEDTGGPVAAPVAPPRPNRPPEVEKRVERTHDQIGFEDFIWDIPDDEAYRLDKLEAIIKERRSEIKG
jgi:hypothetical protein